MSLDTGTLLIRIPRPGLRWAFRLIGVGLLAYVLSTTDLDGIVAAARDIDVGMLLGALAAGIAFIWIKGIRWALVLRLLGKTLPWLSAVRLFAVGLFAGYVTPAQLGEFTKVMYLDRYGIGRLQGLASVIGDRLIDVVLLVLLALPGLGFLVPGFPNRLGALFSLVLLASIAATILVLRRRYVLPTRAIGGWMWVSDRVRFVPPPSAFTVESSNRTLLLLGVSTLAAQAVMYGRMALALEAVGVDMSAHAFFTGIAAMTLAAALPISVAGVGTRDVALIALFAELGYSRELAVLFSTVVLILHFSNALIGFISWIASDYIKGTPIPTTVPAPPPSAREAHVAAPDSMKDVV